MSSRSMWAPFFATARTDRRLREGTAILTCALVGTSVNGRDRAGFTPHLFDLPVNGAYDQAIRILGYGPDRALGSRVPGK